MKKIFILAAIALFLAPVAASAVQSVSVSTSTGSSASATASSTGQVQSAANSNFETSSAVNGNQNQVQTKTQNQNGNTNSGSGTLTQTRTQAEIKLQEQLNASKSVYSAKNSKAASNQSVVTAAVEQLIMMAAQIQNTGIGDQIRLIAQNQTKNYDKISQSIDKADSRSSAVKFFIGSNYKELKTAKQTMTENQNQIKSLELLMAQVSNEGDKISIANQIIALQSVQLELKDQINELSEGFSLFGWINRWYNKF